MNCKPELIVSIKSKTMEENMSKTFGLSLFALLVCGNFAQAQELTARDVASRLQSVYDNTKDFKAAFRQEYKSKALDRSKVSSGYVYVKKPGLMRWDYKKPRPKNFVADGKALFIYDPQLEQVMVDRSFSDSSMSTAVSFLWGQGKLTDDFKVAFKKEAKDKEHYTLVLLPKSKARFKSLLFKVDRKTFLVTETLVVDPGGNTNRITFSKMKTNVGLKEEAFHFQIPNGVDVIEAPDS